MFEMHYHLIMVIKYRRKVINETISSRLQEIFDSIAQWYKISVEEWNHDRDHVQVLFKAHPKSELSKFINAYKSASSRLVKKEFPDIRKFLWTEKFWSKSFCLLTTGGVTKEVIERYIASQGEKHERT